VSILIATGAGVGRCCGSQPRAKVSLIIMRPPQEGHGRGSTRGSSSADVSADLRQQLDRIEQKLDRLLAKLDLGG
jgi:hypothetical protein